MMEEVYSAMPDPDASIEDQVEQVAPPPTTGVAQPYTPPKKGYLTSQFWLTVGAGLVLGVLVWKGILSIDQAQHYADMFGVTWFGIIVTALGSFGWMGGNYVKGRNAIALARQNGFTHLQAATIAAQPAAAMSFGFDWKKLGSIVGKVDDVAAIAGKFGVPGAAVVASVSDIVENVIRDPTDPNNERALQAMAAHLDAVDRDIRKIKALLRVS